MFLPVMNYYNFSFHLQGSYYHVKGEEDELLSLSIML